MARIKNDYFEFKEFTVCQSKAAMKVTTEACLFGALVDSQNVLNILDIGAGTGLLSLMLAQKYSLAEITGVEIDKDAYKQFAENVNASKWSNRIAFIEDNILNIEKTGFDLVVSNPPFFNKHLLHSNDKNNLARHVDGLTFELLFGKVEKLMSENGFFWLLTPKVEFDSLKNTHVTRLKLIKVINIYHSIKHPLLRVVSVWSNSDLMQEFIEENFYIKDEEGNYSEEFIRTLKNFYLNF